MSSVKELKEKLRGIIKPVNELKEKILEKDCKKDPLKNPFHNILAELNADISDTGQSQ